MNATALAAADAARKPREHVQHETFVHRSVLLPGSLPVSTSSLTYTTSNCHLCADAPAETKSRDETKKLDLNSDPVLEAVYRMRRRQHFFVIDGDLRIETLLHPPLLEQLAVYPTRKFVTPKVRALVDYLVSAFPDAL